MSVTSKKTFGPPEVPSTPSATINKMLEQRCKKQFDHPVKFGIAFYICGIFTLITQVYKLINKDKPESHTMWMVSCGVISLAVIIKSFLIYNVLISSAVVMHYLLYYGAIALALFGAGLGVSGAVFFDKEAGVPRPSEGFGSSTGKKE